MRALVTGATGFIGNHLVLELRRRGWDVVCMIRGTVQTQDSSVRCVHGDLLEPESLRFDDIQAGSVDALFHLAALLPSKDISLDRYMQANCRATSLLLQSADRLGIKSVVYASSLPIIGVPKHVPITEKHSANPQHPYHLSKLGGEMECEMARRKQGRRISSLRITSPYGPGMSANGVLARFVDRALKSENIQWLGSGSRAQNFVHVSDVVRATLLAAQTDSPGIYNVGGSETTSMQEFAKLVARLAPGSQSKLSAAGTRDPEEGCRWEVDLAHAATGLGYRPAVSLEQGLTEYIAWAQAEADVQRWWKS